MYLYCNNNPVMGYDPTGFWDWGGVAAGAGLFLIGALIFSNPLTLTTALIGGAFLLTGTVTTAAAATDNAMVVDGSAALPILGVAYAKGGASVVVDFDKDEANLYLHGGGGLGVESGFSYSAGIVSNYDEPGNYSEGFIDVNAGYGAGIDHCWSPEGAYSSATRATCITFSSGFSCGAGWDYYSQPIQIFAW